MATAAHPATQKHPHDHPYGRPHLLTYPTHQTDSLVTPITPGLAATRAVGDTTFTRQRRRRGELRAGQPVVRSDLCTASARAATMCTYNITPNTRKHRASKDVAGTTGV